MCSKKLSSQNRTGQITTSYRPSYFVILPSNEFLPIIVDYNICLQVKSRVLFLLFLLFYWKSTYYVKNNNICFFCKLTIFLFVLICHNYIYICMLKFVVFLTQKNKCTDLKKSNICKNDQ